MIDKNKQFKDYVIIIKHQIWKWFFFHFYCFWAPFATPVSSPRKTTTSFCVFLSLLPPRTVRTYSRPCAAGTNRPARSAATSPRPILKGRRLLMWPSCNWESRMPRLWQTVLFRILSFFWVIEAERTRSGMSNISRIKSQNQSNSPTTTLISVIIN